MSRSPTVDGLKMQAASKYRKTKATADANTDSLTCCGIKLISSLQLMRRAL
jgi:hypothetical protein